MHIQNDFSKKEIAIIPIAVFTAKGDMQKLTLALNSGLESGLTVNEINEILIQMYAYTGFPRSLNAINAFMSVCDDRKAKGIHDEMGTSAISLPDDKTRLQLGTEIQTQLVGTPVKGRIFEFSPAIDQFLKEHLFSDIFGRGVLSYQIREIATVSALASLDGLEDQLRAHINVSLNVGLTVEQMKAYVKIIAEKVGQVESNRVEKALATILKSRNQ